MSEEKPFISAFKKGVERAREIERQSKEINHVIDDLRSQILSVTDNKVEIVITDDKLNYHSSPKENSFEFFLKKNLGLFDKILAAKNKNKIRFLSYWKTNDGGYPCTIKYGNINDSAGDKESLELILEKMLSRPDIVMKILDLSEGDAMQQTED